MNKYRYYYYIEGVKRLGDMKLMGIVYADTPDDALKHIIAAYPNDPIVIHNEPINDNE